MEYIEAVKKAQTKSNKENFMVIETSYDTKLILPYKDGLALMSALINAEQLHEPYNAQHRISEVRRDAFKSHVMSAKEYERFKIAALLNVTIDVVKEYEEAA
jgi:hypothetical protein